MKYERGLYMPFYEREERILSALLEKESMSIRELSAQLYVSQPTLRRDLIKLEQRGKIIYRFQAAPVAEITMLPLTKLWLAAV